MSHFFASCCRCDPSIVVDDDKGEFDGGGPTASSYSVSNDRVKDVNPALPLTRKISELVSFYRPDDDGVVEDAEEMQPQSFGGRNDSEGCVSGGATAALCDSSREMTKDTRRHLEESAFNKRNLLCRRDEELSMKELHRRVAWLYRDEEVRRRNQRIITSSKEAAEKKQGASTPVTSSAACYREGRKNMSGSENEQPVELQVEESNRAVLSINDASSYEEANTEEKGGDKNNASDDRGPKESDSNSALEEDLSLSYFFPLSTSSAGNDSGTSSTSTEATNGVIGGDEKNACKSVEENLINRNAFILKKRVLNLSRKYLTTGEDGSNGYHHHHRTSAKKVKEKKRNESPSPTGPHTPQPHAQARLPHEAQDSLFKRRLRREILMDDPFLLYKLEEVRQLIYTTRQQLGLREVARSKLLSDRNGDECAAVVRTKDRVETSDRRPEFREQLDNFTATSSVSAASCTSIATMYGAHATRLNHGKDNGTRSQTRCRSGGHVENRNQSECADEKGCGRNREDYPGMDYQRRFFARMIDDWKTTFGQRGEHTATTHTSFLMSTLGSSCGPTSVNGNVNAADDLSLSPTKGSATHHQLCRIQDGVECGSNNREWKLRELQQQETYEKHIQERKNHDDAQLRLAVLGLKAQAHTTEGCSVNRLKKLSSGISSDFPSFVAPVHPIDMYQDETRRSRVAAQSAARAQEFEKCRMKLMRHKKVMD